MSFPQRPPLDAYTCEKIDSELHQFDELYWPKITAMRVRSPMMGYNSVLPLNLSRMPMAFQDSVAFSVDAPDEAISMLSSQTAVPGFFCTSGVDTNWEQRSVLWHEGRSIVRSRW
jgi:hypothetical protein